MDRMSFRRASETSSFSDSSFKPFRSPDGHLGSEHELDDLPARMRNNTEAMSPSRTTTAAPRRKSQTSRSGTSSAGTNVSENSSPTHHLINKEKAKVWSPPPPISASIYGSMNPIASILQPSKPSSSPSHTHSMASSSFRHVTFGTANHSAADDPRLILSQREQELHKEIQELLDAQSDGLQAGLGGDNTSASASVMSEGSNTPTSRTAKMPSQFLDEKYSSMVVRPVRQPKKKKPSLRAARRGILRSISELVNLKAEEDALVSADISSKRSILRNIDSWEKKISGFQKAIEDTSKSEEARELKTLQTEKHAVEAEIQELETRLLQMHAKQQNLGYRITELENRHESGVSSYKEGLRLAQRNVENFLSDSGRGRPLDGTGFWALPKKRRTLGLAREHYTEELESSKALKSRILVEGRALIEGADVWAEAMNEILAWEANLRKAIASPADEQEDSLKRVLKDLNTLIMGLDGNEQVAVEKGWKLLIVAIGAELAYLREGQGVLQNILGIADVTQDSGPTVGTITREDTNGFNESFRTAEDGTEDSNNLHDQHHGLSELDTDLPANSDQQPHSPQIESGYTPPLTRSRPSPYNSLPNSIIRTNSGNDRMISSASGSGHFKNGSLTLSKNPESSISPPQIESPPNGSNGEATPLRMSPGRGNGFFSQDKMMGSGRLTMTWRDKGKGRLGQRKESTTDESEDEGPDPELLVGNLTDDIE